MVSEEESDIHFDFLLLLRRLNPQPSVKSLTTSLGTPNKSCPPCSTSPINAHCSNTRLRRSPTFLHARKCHPTFLHPYKKHLALNHHFISIKTLGEWPPNLYPPGFGRIPGCRSLMRNCQVPAQVLKTSYLPSLPLSGPYLAATKRCPAH